MHFCSKRETWHLALSPSGRDQGLLAGERRSANVVELPRWFPRFSTGKPLRRAGLGGLCCPYPALHGPWLPPLLASALGLGSLASLRGDGPALGRHPASRPPAQPAVSKDQGSPSGRFYKVRPWLWQTCLYVSQGSLGLGEGQVAQSQAQRLVFPKSAQRSTRAAHRGSLWGARASGQGTEMARGHRLIGLGTGSHGSGCRSECPLLTTGEGPSLEVQSGSGPVSSPAEMGRRCEQSRAQA